MAVDPAFVGAGKKPGMEIWRIEKLKVVRQDPKTHGEFYSGDSYICLSTKKTPGKNRFDWDIHFWLGKDTTQDEAGVAAYKTVELDDSLGGAPVQHREVQGHESGQFMSYFKQGVRYLEGGIETGFKKVERGKYETRLLHLKGKRMVRVTQVELSVDSLNAGDVFILDCGLEIFTWFGPESSRVERIKGMEVARQIRDDMRGGKAEITVVEPDMALIHTRFFKALDATARVSQIKIKPASEGGDDVEFERQASVETTLHRVCDESGKLEINTIDKLLLEQKDLDTKDCFILEAGRGGIFVWVGKGCTENEKKSAWRLALDFLDKKGYPKWTKCTRVVEGGETALFKQFFKDWKEKDAQEGFGNVYKTSSVAKVEQTKFDVRQLHKRKERSAESIPDDGQGEVQIWRIQDFSLCELPDDMYGIFFGGDSYVILYTYRKKGKRHHIIYYWLGTMSTADEKASAAMLSQQMREREFNSLADVIRAAQNKEPEHFLIIFKGRMIVFKGGTASGFRNKKELDEEDKDSNLLFQVRGTTSYNTRAVQVFCTAASLNSNDVFVLKSGEKRKTYVWIGTGANNDEKEMSQTVAKRLSNGQEIVTIYEGNERQEFWTILGGKLPYATGPRLKDGDSILPARLFHCSNASGKICIEEILDFAQEDLNINDVMILDAYDEIFVWVGKGARAFEKREALEATLEYIKTDPSGRTEDNTQLFTVKQGHEPLNFTLHFLAWDPKKFAVAESSVEEGPDSVIRKSENDATNSSPTLVTEELAKYNAVHPYSRLIDPERPLPEGVDSLQKERYLSNDEFEEIFGMTKTMFYELKPWKQTMLKKQKKLF